MIWFAWKSLPAWSATAVLFRCWCKEQACHEQGISRVRSPDWHSENAFEIRDTHFDQDVAQLVDVLVPTWWQKLGRTLQRRPIYSAAALLTIVLLGLWIYPKIALTPERARIEIGQMGLK